MNYQFKTNMVCQHCIRTVTPHLNALEFVDIWHVDLEHADKVLYVEMEKDDPSEIIRAVENAGFTIEKLVSHS